MLERTISLLGEENVQKLLRANVCVVGVGGVGGAVIEVLARSGVQNLTIVDGDVISNSNLNRQIFATQQNVGNLKATEMKKRILSINPTANVNAQNVFLSNQNIEQIFCQTFDFVVDAVDDISAKVLLAKTCQNQNVSLVSALGAGNRFGVPNYAISDVFSTSYDPLAKVFRKKLREAGITKLDVCVSAFPSDVRKNPPASVMWHPMAMGAVLAGFVVNKILQKEK